MARPSDNSKLASRLMIAVGLAGICTPMFWSVRAELLQRALQREAAAQSLAPVSASISQNPEIVIPKIGLDAVVVEETTPSDLDRGPMHIAGTGLPGEVGNCCIAAHKEKWFHKLKRLKTGDRVAIRSRGKNYVYVVTSRQIVKADSVSVLRPTATATLTLITCTGPAYFGRGNGRLVVKANLLKNARNTK